MRGRRPPTLLTFARRSLSRGGEIALARGSRLLVAVSGGPDSMALLDVAARLSKDLRFSVVAHGVDHGLRPEAKDELDLAAAVSTTLGVPFGRSTVEVPRGGNLQARARRARYEALAAAARREGATIIATAHHADDRAETVLLRLLRGAGPLGMAVLPARAPFPLPPAESLELVRPLLRARRRDVVAHLVRHRIPFASDPSNHDSTFLRARVRAELMPLLEELSPSIVLHLNALADQLSAERRENGPPLALPRATQDALARLLALRGSLPRASARVWLPGGLIVTAEGVTKPDGPD